MGIQYKRFDYKKKEYFRLRHITKQQNVSRMTMQKESSQKQKCFVLWHLPDNVSMFPREKSESTFKNHMLIWSSFPATCLLPRII